MTDNEDNDSQRLFLGGDHNSLFQEEESFDDWYNNYKWNEKEQKEQDDERLNDWSVKRDENRTFYYLNKKNEKSYTKPNYFVGPKRLPTDAEWDLYIALGGTQSHYEIDEVTDKYIWPRPPESEEDEVPRFNYYLKPAIGPVTIVTSGRNYSIVKQADGIMKLVRNKS